ncbi:MAG: DeoR family transcriptional regulator [Anaerolineae bacterium]
MTTFERRQRILSILRQQSSVKVTDLAKLLGVSEGTIRSDLIELDEDQLLMRVRVKKTRRMTFPPLARFSPAGRRSTPRPSSGLPAGPQKW